MWFEIIYLYHLRITIISKMIFFKEYMYSILSFNLSTTQIGSVPKLHELFVPCNQ